MLKQNKEAHSLGIRGKVVNATTEIKDKIVSAMDQRSNVDTKGAMAELLKYLATPGTHDDFVLSQSCVHTALVDRCPLPDGSDEPDGSHASNELFFDKGTKVYVHGHRKSDPKSFFGFTSPEYSGWTSMEYMDTKCEDPLDFTMVPHMDLLRKMFSEVAISPVVYHGSLYSMSVAGSVLQSYLIENGLSETEATAALNAALEVGVLHVG